MNKKTEAAEKIVSQVWHHMNGYNLDGKRLNPLDDTGECARNWQKLRGIVEPEAKSR